VRDQAAEAVGVARDPVDHVAAVRGAGGAGAALLDEGLLLDRVDELHQVLVDLASPVSGDIVDEGLAVAGRAARVGQRDQMAARREQRRVPAVRPRVLPRALRSAVDQHDQGVLALGIEPGRPVEEAVHARARGALGLEVLGGEAELDAAQRRLGQPRQPHRGGAVERNAPDFGGLVHA
jgi:hypothetical protein